MTSVVNLESIPPAERFGIWKDAISRAFVPLEARVSAAHGAFHGSLVAQSVGTVEFCEVRGGPVQVDRSARTIRQSDPGHLKLGLQLNGYSVLTQDGREAALTPGDIALYDTSRPYQLSFEQDFRMLVLMFPREHLRLRPVDLQSVTAHRLSGRQGIGSLVSPFLMGVARQMITEELVPSLDLSDAVLSLIAAAFSEQLDCESLVSPETHKHALMLRIKSFIDARLDDPDLTTANIASSHHISTRYLQKLFESEGTTASSWIRQRRLDRVRQDLSDARFGQTSIGTVAGRWGLVDASHFSRLFREAYGTTPREYRLRAMGD